MTAETFENIMDRNNTTLPAAQIVGEKDMIAGPSKRGPKKNGLLIAAFALFVCFCLVSTVGSASTHIPRKREIASSAETTTGMPKICSQNTPCGWAIYIPFTRRIDYFMKNTCECKHGLACLKTDDDLSVNAYVYRCKPRPAVMDSDVMPTI